MTSRSLGHRAPLLWLVIPWMGGLAAGSLFDLESTRGCLAAAFVLSLVSLVAGFRAPRFWACSVVPAMLFGGCASYTLHRARLSSWDSLPPREVRLTLRIDRIFPQDDIRKASGLASVVGTSRHLPALIGQRIYFSLQTGRGVAVPVRSANFSATGVLAVLPRHPPPDTFDGYLAAAGTNFKLSRGRLQQEESRPLAYYRFCARTAARFKAILGLGIEKKRPDLAGLLRAMMLGETHELSDDQHALFMRSGTMHLFAISGLNITVVAVALESILRMLRLPALVRFSLGVLLLWIFVDITGGSSSAIRAFVMTAFLQAARILRRPGNPFAALVASAGVVLLIAPLQVFSASFLMSYGIVTALLVLGLPLGEAWERGWSPWRDLPIPTWRRWQHGVAHTWRALVLALAIGIATSLVGLLTGVQFFHLLTPGALLANLVLIPAAVVATAGGFTAVVCGLAHFETGAVLCNHAAALTLLAIERLVRLSVALPGAFVPAQFVLPWIGMAALSMLVASLLVGYAAGWQRFGRWWPPFAIVGVTLLWGVRFG